jgi:hypothetical protein
MRATALRVQDAFRRVLAYERAPGGLPRSTLGGYRNEHDVFVLVRVSDASSGRTIPSLGGASGAFPVSMQLFSVRCMIAPTAPVVRELIDLAERMGIPTGDAVSRVLQHLDGFLVVDLPLRNRNESGAE